MKLEQWGWNPFFEDNFKQYRDLGLIEGRVVSESRHLYKVITPEKEYSAAVSGHFMYTSLNSSEYPTIGDWVALRIDGGTAVIEKLLPRKSSFSRKKAGVETEEQIIAANIDYIFLVFGLDGGRNFSRGGLERFLLRAWDSGATPVIILNKLDLAEDPEEIFLEAQSVSAGAEIYLTSAATGEGLEFLDRYLKPGTTVGFTGFSGVGKSALINRLCGTELRKTGELRQGDLRGRHTTTSKDLIQLPGGALLIDSPGIKELQLWGDEESLDQAFGDISDLAGHCRFSDCSHNGEPGCAVQSALATGELDHRRFEDYLDLQRELRYMESKMNKRQALEEKAKWKKISKYQKSFKRQSYH